jgi:hypothetical protein
MMLQCRNPNNANFRRYGAKGITICERWLTFDNFFADMGERPEGMTLDRIDGAKNYELSNCRWATQKEQARQNKRMAWFDGKLMSRREIAAYLGITHANLNWRMRNGKVTLVEA